MSKHFLAFSILALSLALLYNGYQLGQGAGIEKEKVTVPAEKAAKGLMTIKEAA